MTGYTPLEKNRMDAHVEIGRQQEAARSARLQEGRVVSEFAEMAIPFQPYEHETISAAQSRVKHRLLNSNTYHKTYKEQAADACSFSVYAAACCRILTNRNQSLRARNIRLVEQIDHQDRLEARSESQALDTDDKLAAASASLREAQWEVVLLRTVFAIFVFVLALVHIASLKGYPKSTYALSPGLYSPSRTMLACGLALVFCHLTSKVMVMEVFKTNAARWLAGPFRRRRVDCDKPAHELAGDPRYQLEQRIVAFYSKHCPAKLSGDNFAERIAEKYSYPGGEEALFRTLKTRYSKKE